MMIFYFYLVCFTLSVLYSVFPFHLVYDSQLLQHFLMLSQAFIKHRKLLCVCVYIYI